MDSLRALSPAVLADDGGGCRPGGIPAFRLVLPESCLPQILEPLPRRSIDHRFARPAGSVIESSRTPQRLMFAGVNG